MISVKRVPERYKGKLTQTLIWKNTARLINYSFDGNKDAFRCALESALIGKTIKYDNDKVATIYHDDANSKSNFIINRCFHENGDKHLTVNGACEIEQALDLVPGSLLSTEVEKDTAYVFVYCEPRYTSAIYNWLIDLDHSVVDEVSILSGEVDVFLRLYGTRNELKHFISDILNGNEDTGVAPPPIQRTNTHFSFSGDVWQRYPAKSHSQLRASRPYWIKPDWRPPT